MEGGEERLGLWWTSAGLLSAHSGNIHLSGGHLGLIYKPTSKPQPRLFHFIKESCMSPEVQGTEYDFKQSAVRIPQAASTCPLYAPVTSHSEGGKVHAQTTRTQVINPYE